MHRWLPAFIITSAAVWGTSTAALAQAPAAPADATATDSAPAAEPSPLVEEPSSPQALMEAIVLMRNLERPNLARRYLETLLKQPLDDTVLLLLRDRHGPAIFLELSNDERLQPQSIQLLDRLNDAFRRYALDPTRMDRLIAQLTGTSEQREIATIQLRSTGAVAVPRMLAVARMSKEAGQRDAIIYALTRMGRQAIPALLGALDAPTDDVRSVALDSLGWIDAPEVVMWLWFPAYGPDQSSAVRDSARRAMARLLRNDSRKTGEINSFGAIQQLQTAAERHFRHEHPWTKTDDGLVEYWSWDADQDGLNVWKVSPETASLVAGSRFARQALAMSPDRRDLQALYLSIRLAYDAHLAGWNNPLPTGTGTSHDLALLAGPDVALDALTWSLRNPNPSAALGMLQVLGQIGNRGQLAARGGMASPVVQALNYPDFRVQFAAASTILQLDPDRSFRGASRVVWILSRALNDSGDHSSLAIDPNPERGQATAGQLGEMGYLGQSVQTGQEGFKAASERGDIDIIAVHAASVDWGLNQTVANLRADARTSGIPIVIYGPEAVQYKVSGLLEQYPLVTFAIEGETSFKIGVRQFLARLSTPAVSDAERDARITAAAFWFAHIATGRRTDLFDLRPAEEALFAGMAHPEAATNCVIALGAIPTPTAQQRLHEIVTSEAHSPELREVACQQLAFHFQKHGPLISAEQVGMLVQAHAQAQEPGLKTALASVVGSLRPDTTRVIDLLKNFPPPALPKVE